MFLYSKFCICICISVNLKEIITKHTPSIMDNKPENMKNQNTGCNFEENKTPSEIYCSTFQLTQKLSTVM